MHRLRNRTFFRLAIAAALLLVFLGFSVSAVPVSAFAAQQSASASSDGVTFTVEWDDAVPAGEVTTFHVSATGCSDSAMARMDAPLYYDRAGNFEVVCDPTRGVYDGYHSLVNEALDFTFEFAASGTYEIRFYFMDAENGIYYLRTTAVVSIDDVSRPSVDQIVSEAVAKAQSNTDGSDYQMALWLHDWLLDQLEYDSTYVWSSAESGLTQGKGTCESYQRIYQRLLNSAGIANARMTGNGHTWNAVKIDGAWCQVDPTWGDQSDAWYGFNMKHFYFGLTDELMGAVHPDLVSQYQADDYACRSTDFRNSYYVREGEAAEWASAYKDRVQSKLDAGITEFVIVADGLNSESSYTEQIYNGNVAYALSQMSWQASGKSVKLQVTSDETSFIFKADYSNEQGSGDSSPGGLDTGGSGADGSGAGGSGVNGSDAWESGADGSGAAGESGATEPGSSEANGTGSNNGSVEPGGADNAGNGKIDSGSRNSRAQITAIPVLKKVTGLKLKAKKKAIKLSWKKGSADISGYQIRYSKSKKMKRAKTIKLARAAAKSKTIKKLAKKKRYYVQVRSYKILNGKTYYSAWSSKKSAKTK